MENEIVETEVMETETTEITTMDSWKIKALAIGGVIGATVGVAAAYLLIQRSKDGEPPKISVGEGVKLGVLVFGLLRSISNL
jgi:hypothetical protein